MVSEYMNTDRPLIADRPVTKTSVANMDRRNEQMHSGLGFVEDIPRETTPRLMVMHVNEPQPPLQMHTLADAVPSMSNESIDSEHKSADGEELKPISLKKEKIKIYS